MSRGRPHVFTIPAGIGFAEALAARLLDETAGDPLALAGYRVLLPTRRACRALQEAFLRRSEGRPLLLPRLEPLGDIEPGPRRGQALGRGDVIPLAVMAQPIEASSLDRTAPERMDREGSPFCFWGQRAFEEPGMQDLDAGEDEGRHLPRVAEGDPAKLVHGEIARAVIAHGADRRIHDQRRQLRSVGPGVERAARGC